MAEKIGYDNTETTPASENPIVSQYNRNFCKYCGWKLQAGAVFCSSCGRPQGNVPIQQPTVQMTQQPVYRQPYISGAYQQPRPAMTSVSNNSSTTVVVERSRSNSIGSAGFIFALLGLIFCWVPIVDFLLWGLGLLFSFVGLFKAPRGMAIAGFILSLLAILIILTLVGSIAAVLQSL